MVGFSSVDTRSKSVSDRRLNSPFFLLVFLFFLCSQDLPMATCARAAFRRTPLKATPQAWLFDTAWRIRPGFRGGRRLLAAP